MHFQVNQRRLGVFQRTGDVSICIRDHPCIEINLSQALHVVFRAGLEYVSRIPSRCCAIGISYETNFGVYKCLDPRYAGQCHTMTMLTDASSIRWRRSKKVVKPLCRNQIAVTSARLSGRTLKASVPVLPSGAALRLSFGNGRGK